VSCVLEHFNPLWHSKSDLFFLKVPQGSIITVQIRIKRDRAQDATLERVSNEIFLQKSVNTNANNFSLLL